MTVLLARPLVRRKMSIRTPRSNLRRPSKPAADKQARNPIQHTRDADLRSCDIVQTTVLTSPNRTALALVRVGDTLTVEFRPGPPSLLVAMTNAGTAAGAITCASKTQIAKCTQLGVKYVAKVLSLRGHRCRVRIRRRSPRDTE
jgi:hypothetical protein